MGKIIFRKANISDSEIYFKWINDPVVREQSFNSELVSWENHIKWFSEKLFNPNFCFYIFQDFNNENIGQVRFQKIDQLNSLISVSIATGQRGKGLGHKILKLACKDYFKKHPKMIINAYIKIENIASRVVFEKAGFCQKNIIIYKHFNSYHYNLLCK